MMTLLSFIVIYNHALNVELFISINDHTSTIARLEETIASIGQMAVAGFFMVSGYLFFRDFTIKKLPLKWKRRFFSVFIPYVVWNGLYYLGYFIASRLPFWTEIVGKGKISFSIHELPSILLHYRYNYVFWFVFQLLLLIGISPLLYMGIKNRIVGICFIILLSFVIYYKINIIYINEDAIWYYTVAGYGALHAQEFIEEKISISRFVFGLFFIFLGIFTFYLSEALSSVLCIVLSRFFGAFGIWLSLFCPSSYTLPNLFQRSFFIYAIHFSFIRIINKIGARFLPHTQLFAGILYLGMPIYIFLLANLCAEICRHICPRFYRILSGKRP